MKNKLQILITIILAGFLGWWISFQSVLQHQGKSIQWFENTYGIVALIGSIIGFVAVKKWGGIRTVFGKALFFFSLGLLFQEAGQLIYSYYTQVDKIQIPYPSLGDVAYFGSVLLYIVANIFLAKAVGVRFSLKQTRYKTIAIIVPLILIAASYRILLYHHNFDTTKPVTEFLDAGYPIGEAIYISIALVTYLLSRKMLGGILKPAILTVLLAMLIQYASDFLFVYQGNKGTYTPGAADDLLYLISYFTLTTAMVSFLVAHRKLTDQLHTEKHKSAEQK